MTANATLTDNEPADYIVAWLKARLPTTWEIGPTLRTEIASIANGQADTAIDLRGSNGVHTTLLVEIKTAFGPRDVERLQGGLGRTLRALAGNIPLMVFAPWLSERTQGLLRSDGINYLDRTGNSYVRLDNPTVYIETRGAGQDPSPKPRGKARVQGPKAWRLIRTLLDIQPPYGVRNLASAVQLTPGYVSRLLDALDEDALVQRSPRGAVTDVDVHNLIRRWAESYDVFRTNTTMGYLAPRGAAWVIQSLQSVRPRTAVTGSFAAVRLAPVAAPTLFAAYSDNPSGVAEELDLIPADAGANVILMRPFDPVVWARTTRHNGITYVSPSQAAIDCLTGNGRMPAEGAALLEWMALNETSWRLSDLSETDKENP